MIGFVLECDAKSEFGGVLECYATKICIPLISLMFLINAINFFIYIYLGMGRERKNPYTINKVSSQIAT